MARPRSLPPRLRYVCPGLGQRWLPFAHRLAATLLPLATARVAAERARKDSERMASPPLQQLEFCRAGVKPGARPTRERGKRGDQL